MEEKLKIKFRSGDKPPRWIKSDPQMADRELPCTISDIKVEILKTSLYKLNPLRWLIITLNLTDRPSESFQVKYAPITDCEEFLVFSALYYDSLDRRYEPDDRCMALFEEHSTSQWFSGTILDDYGGDGQYQRYLVKCRVVNMAYPGYAKIFKNLKFSRNY